MTRKEYKHSDTNNSADDEFGFNYNISDNKPKKKKKAKKKKKPKEKFNHFKGLGGGSSSRGPWLK